MSVKSKHSDFIYCSTSDLIDVLSCNAVSGQTRLPPLPKGIDGFLRVYARAYVFETNGVREVEAKRGTLSFVFVDAFISKVIWIDYHGDDFLKNWSLFASVMARMVHLKYNF